MAESNPNEASAAPVAKRNCAEQPPPSSSKGAVLETMPDAAYPKSADDFQKHFPNEHGVSFAKEAIDYLMARRACPWPLSWNHALSCAPVFARALVQKSLALLPAQRISAIESLNHAYVADFHNTDDEPSSDGPILINIDDNTKVRRARNAAGPLHVGRARAPRARCLLPLVPNKTAHTH